MKFNTGIVVFLIGLTASRFVSMTTPWEQYLENPTPQNASKVVKISYSRGADARKQLFDDLRLLEVQVVSGDREALRLGFRLLRDADGHLAETLDIMLGRLIRINPRLFLEELQASRGRNAGLVNLVRAFGEPYIDRETAQAYEASARIAALRTVEDVTLTALRDDCIRALRPR